jgi:hypothetical protein
LSALNLDALTLDTFQATPTLDDGRLMLHFAGSGDMNAITPLSVFLKQAHEEATRLGVTEVGCNLQQLAFMNSSCFKSFVVWIDTVKNAQAGYLIRFRTDPSVHWQRRSLEALRRLATNIVEIEVAPKT